MKKGFTLIELLATVVILVLLGLVAIVTVQSVIDKGGQKALDATLIELKNAAETYVRTEGEPSWCNNKTVCFISLRLLAYRKYIKLDENNNYVNPKTSRPFSLDMVVMIRRYGNNYQFEAFEDYSFLTDYLNQAKQDAVASSVLIYKLKGLCGNNTNCVLSTSILENQNLIETGFYNSSNISINSRNEISIN